MTFAECQLALQVKLAGAPSRGPKRKAILDELRQLVTEELRAELGRQRDDAAIVPTGDPQHPPRPADLFDSDRQPETPPFDPYGSRGPYWIER